MAAFLIAESGMKRIGEIVTNYEPDQWEAALKRPLVRELYFKRLKQTRSLLEAEKRDGEIALLDWLEQSPQVLIRNLSALKMLLSYPETIGKSLFGAAFSDIMNLRLDFRKISTISQGNERVLDEIRVFLSKSNPSTIEELDHLIDQMSGLLEIEFTTIYQILQKGQLDIDSGTCRKDQGKIQVHSRYSLYFPEINRARSSYYLLKAVPPSIRMDGRGMGSMGRRLIFTLPILA